MDEAPPVKTSTLSNSKVGTVFKSAQFPPPVVPETILRPFIRTSVLEQPKFRKFAVAVPEAPLELVIDCPADN